MCLGWTEKGLYALYISDDKPPQSQHLAIKTVHPV